MNAQLNRWGKTILTSGRGAVLALMASIPLTAIPFGVSHGAIQGSPLEISVDSSSVLLSDDQQNPYVIEISDKGLWFVVWEDWRNWSTSGADIYGRFIRSDGSFCGNEIVVSNASNHQTVPVAAYREADAFGRSGDKILVAWQDGRGSGSAGYIYHKAITLPATINCSSLPTPGSESAISYTAVQSISGGYGPDTLASRSKPSISYEPVGDTFWLGWRESRSELKHNSENCFGISIHAWNFGDEDHVGYVGIDAATLAEKTNAIGVNGADIVRNRTRHSVRFISSSGSTFVETYEYEFFDDINNVVVGSDMVAAETYLAWEGVARTAVMTCNCEDVNQSEVCDVGDAVTSSLETSDRNDGLTHIGGIPKGLIHLASTYSDWIDSDSTGAGYYPAIGLDPVSRKFLVVWEDMRDGPESKVYGQLLHSGGGHYNRNFIISYSDSDSDGTQDANVAGTRQTRPSVSYDFSHQRFFVTWQDGRNTRTSLENLDIYGQFIDSEGSLRGDNMPISVATGNQYNPSTAYNRDNHQFLTVWKDSRNANEDNGQDTFSDILGQRFSLGQPQLNLVNTDDTTLVPPLFDYGVLTVGQSASQTVKLVNSGDTYVNVDCVDPYPANAPYNYAFAIPTELQTCNDGLTLPLVPSSEYLLSLQFAPATTGTFIDHFTIYSDAGSPTVFLQGIANSAVTTTAAVVTSPGDVVDCGTVGSAETRSVNLVVSNTGNTNVTVTAMDLPTAGTPFSISGIGAGSVITAKSSLYAVVQCNGAAAGGAGDFTSPLRLLFDSGVGEIELSLQAIVSSDAIASTSSTTTTSSSTTSSSSIGTLVSEWRVYDTWDGNEVAQGDLLQIYVDANGNYTGSWGPYQFPMTVQPGVGVTWNFTNGTYTWYYVFNSGSGDEAYGTWQYNSGAGVSSALATRAVRVR